MQENALLPKTIGPVKTDRGWNLFMAAAIHKPTVEEAKDEIRSALMEQLLSKLRSEATISYHMSKRRLARNAPADPAKR